MDEQLARGVANSLWPYLRAGRWQRHVCMRDLGKWNPAGYRGPGPRTGSVASSSAASTVVVQHDEWWIAALLLAEEWPGVECRVCRGAGRSTVPVASSGMGAWYEHTDVPCHACTGTGVLKSSWAIRLSREAHDRTLLGLTSTQRFAYLACHRSIARAPFWLRPNRHGALRLRRHPTDPHIDSVSAGVLVTIARAARIVWIDEARVDAYLVDDRGW